MRVRVLFFGGLKDLAGKSSDLLELPDGALVRDVLAHYLAQVPGMRELAASLAVAVNQEYAGAETRLKSDDEVALLPPVSGGSEGETPSPSASLRAGSQPAGRRRYALIVRDPIDALGVLQSIKRGEDGAAVVFEGVVRNETQGRRTLYLDYEAYQEMAQRQMENLAEQALKQFQVREVALVHRLGRLEIGETSELIEVASAHRAG